MDNQVGIYPILHNLCFSFPWVLQPSQEKLKRMLMQNFFFFFGGGGRGAGGQARCIMGNVEVAYTIIAFTALNIISSTIYVFLRS